MRLIDADALMENIETAIRNMKGMVKFLGIEDDPEMQMEIKAYTDIANGIKEMPTIEPERKPGNWLWDRGARTCSVCGQMRYIGKSGTIDNFCPNCGADMREAKS